jgi:tetratricopeptide (TPR) repeat protein
MRIRIYAALLFLALSCAAFAQNTTIKGKVTDRDGNVVDGAQVLFQGDKESGVKYTLKTNKKGEFFSLGIRKGVYDVTVSKDGNTIYREQVAVDYNQDKNNFDFDARKATPFGVQVEPAAKPAQTQPGAPGDQPAAAGQQPEIDPNKPIVLTEEQKKKLTPEQLKEYEKYQQTMSYNATVKNVNATLAQAKAANEAGNPDQAAQLVSQVTQASPNLALPWAVLGQYQLNAAKKATDPPGRLERYNAAATSFQKGISVVEGAAEGQPDARLKVDLPKWRLGYGNALVGSRKYDEAIKVFEQAAQEAGTVDPKAAASANYNAGVAAVNAGKTDIAVTYFDKTIAADPTHADAYYQKGVALLGKATVDKAGKMVAPAGTEEAFDKYLELAPDGPNAEGAKQMLEAMGSKVPTRYKKK